MVKSNYSAWKVDSWEFSEEWAPLEKLLFFARYAVLAPSGHNTQPWLIVPKDDSLTLKINKDHYLSVDGSGMLSVEPYISLGTFIEVLELAARGFGYELDTKLVVSEERIAEIRLGGRVSAEPELLKAITERVSNRNPFLTESLPRPVLDGISTTDIPGVFINLITDRGDIDFVAAQTKPAIESIMGHPLYRDELSHWVRSNQTRKYDGMPGFTHGFGSIKALLSKPAIRKGAKLGPQGDKSAKLIKQSGGLVIVSCTADKKEAFINAGRCYSLLCVLARRHGVASSALGASVLDPVTREKVKQRFGINNRPIYILRMGAATIESRHAPRWPLDKVVSRAEN